MFHCKHEAALFGQLTSKKIHLHYSQGVPGVSVGSSNRNHHLGQYQTLQKKREL